MRDPFARYDAWKTATPDGDLPDIDVWYNPQIKSWCASCERPNWSFDGIEASDEEEALEKAYIWMFLDWEESRDPYEDDL